MEKTKNLKITKELFIETIEAIEKQYRHDRECADAFKVILPNDHVSCYDNHYLNNQLIKLLQIGMDDNHKHSWIDYYIWELDFGKKYKKGDVKVHNEDFNLVSASDLWDLLHY